MYPAAGQTVYDEFGALITADGIVATIDAYYEALLIQGKLLRGDPLDTNVRPIYRLTGVSNGQTGLLTIALASLDGLADGVTIVTAGFYARGDVGGGSFEWSVSQAATPDGCTIIDSPNGQWALLGSTVSVRQCGAKGDGVTNDLLSIRAAVASAAESGRRVFFPSGVYAVAPISSNGTVRVTTSGLQIFGAGAGLSVIKVLSTWNDGYQVPCVFNIMSPEIFSGAQPPSNSAYWVRNIQILDLGFEGLPVDANHVKAISGIGTERITVARCGFDDFAAEAIWPSGPNTTVNQRWSVTSNSFAVTTKQSRPGSCLQCNFDNSEVSGNVLTRVTGGIGVTGNGNKVFGNGLFNTYREAIGVGEVAATGLQNSVFGNVVEIENDTAIGNVGIAIYVANGLSVSGNTVRVKTTVMSSATARGIYCYAVGKGNALTGNTVEMDMDGLNVGIEAVRFEIATDEADYSVNGNKVVVLNENTSASRYGIGAFTTGGICNISLGTNTVRGISGSGGGVGIFCNEQAGGVMRANASGNVCGGGAQRYKSTFYGTDRIFASPANDNIPIYCSTVAAVAIV